MSEIVAEKCTWSFQKSVYAIMHAFRVLQRE